MQICEYFLKHKILRGLYLQIEMAGGLFVVNLYNENLFNLSDNNPKTIFVHFIVDHQI